MTRTPYDQYAKQYLEGLLQPLGTPKVSREVAAEVRQVDVWFVPNEITITDHEVLGILGRMVATPCLLEPFRNPASVNDVRACLGKLLQLQAETLRQTKRQKKKLSEAELPYLWILVPSSSRQLLQQFGAEQRADWTAGIHFLPESFRTALVAIANLPVAADTLWLRLLGRGAVQQQAIAELLLINHPFRRHALEQLAILQVTLQARQNLNREDKELVMNLSPVYEQWKAETLEAGVEAGERRATEGFLVARFGQLDEELTQIVPNLIALPPIERSRLILNLSRIELLKQFQS